MKKLKSIMRNLFLVFFSPKTKEKSEKIIVYISIISFLLHLFIIALVNLKFIEINDHNNLLSNPISAIYTPFSFVLIYEVYLMLYYLPKSTSIYIGKQYEIICLILIRRIFKDLSNLELTTNWFNIKYNVLFTYDLIAILILFWLIYIYYKLVKNNSSTNLKTSNPEIVSFITLKQNIATCLIPVLIVLSIYSFTHWIFENFFSLTKIVNSFKDVNKIFFDDFFTILILVDVLLLIYSFLHSDKFNKVIKNSGFIISTILIKLSFSASGLVNIILIVVAILFGVLIFKIHNLFEKLENK